MSKFKCKECGGAVSMKAPICPACGAAHAFTLPPTSAEPPSPPVVSRGCGIYSFAFLAILAAGVAWLAFSSSSDREDWKAVGAVATPATATAHPPIHLEIVEILLYLRGIELLEKAAGKACFRANQCGSVDPGGTSGEVATASDIEGCLDERIPICDKAWERLRAVHAPMSIAAPWAKWHEYRINRHRKEAAFTSAVIDDVGLPRPGSVAEEHLLSWALAKKVPAVVKYYAPGGPGDSLSGSDVAKQAQAAILAKLPGVCRKNVNCTLGKIQHGGLMSVHRRFERHSFTARYGAP